MSALRRKNAPCWCQTSRAWPEASQYTFMPILKLPISSINGPLRGPASGADVSVCQFASQEPLFDFRSVRFCTDALTLARTTGCSLDLCRQELFIAEGDMVLAFEWLVSGYNITQDAPVLH
jgi:hypothetical protein